MGHTVEAKYKCRLCGETFTDGVCGKETAHAVIVALTVKQDFYLKESGLGVHRHTAHRCNDCDLGFADFIGFEPSAYWWMSPDELANELKTREISDGGGKP